jgi:hypothetical protein
VSVQVNVSLLLAVTVPDLGTATHFHNSSAAPPAPSPVNPNMLATRAQAAAHALSLLVHAGAFHGIPMPNIGASLKRSALGYPAVLDANVSIMFPEASGSFQAVRSPQMDTRELTLQAFAEDAAFALEMAVRAVPDLPESIGVRLHLDCNPRTLDF